MIAGVFAAFAWQTPNNIGTASTNGSLPGATNTPTATPIAGPRMYQLALDQGALTSLFVAQLGAQQGSLTNLKVVPLPNDGVMLSLNLNINASGIHRVMPIELDGTIGIDAQQNLQLHILRLKRDGLDAGSAAAASMQSAINQLIGSSIMPTLRGELKGVKLISAHTSSTISCGKNVEMFVLLIQAPPIQGIAGQLTPVPFCFKGTIDPRKLLPN